VSHRFDGQAPKDARAHQKEESHSASGLRVAATCLHELTGDLTAGRSTMAGFRFGSARFLKH
jgi:hypothetical protein